MKKVGCQNADSGMALDVGADKLLPFGRRCARGGERYDELGFLGSVDKCRCHKGTHSTT